MSEYQTVTFCQCTDLVVVLQGDNCYFLKGSIEDAPKKDGDEVWFLRFHDIPSAVLVWLWKFSTFQEVLESLRSSLPDCPRYSYVQLLAMETAEKLAIIKSISGTYDTDWYRGLDPIIRDLSRIYNRGWIYDNE